MKTEMELNQSPRRSEGNLGFCAIAGLLACLLILIWGFLPLIADAQSLDAGRISRQVLIPIGFISLHVGATLLTSSLVAALFARSNWRSTRVAPGPSLIGIALFGAQAILLWRIALALGLAHRADPVFCVLPGIAASFLSTWFLLEPLLRLSRDLNDAAQLDGLGFAGIYRHILLPRMKARILVASILPLAAGLACVLPALTAGP